MNKKITTVGVDLAKDIIQVCLVTDAITIFNKAMNPRSFTQWLCQQTQCLIVFEACSTSNCWYQFAKSQSHDAQLISAHLVESIRVM